MEIAILGLWGVFGLLLLVGTVCFVLVVVKMFQHDQTGLGITCIVLGLCTGIGAMIAFVVGWMNSTQWAIRGVMMTWTTVILVKIFLVCGIFGLGAVVAGIGTNANKTFQTVGQSIGSRP